MGEENHIFISYRRGDSSDVTGRIYDRLGKHYGNENIFKDVDSIPFGVDFRKYIDHQVGQCKILLAIIGRNWAQIKTEQGQVRLKDPQDFVRIEIYSALKRGIPVIPLLVRGVKMPTEKDLPNDLKKLIYRNGIPVRSDPDFHNDMNRLIKGLDEHLAKFAKKGNELKKKEKTEAAYQSEGDELKQKQDDEVERAAVIEGTRINIEKSFWQKLDEHYNIKLPFKAIGLGVIFLIILFIWQSRVNNEEEFKQIQIANSIENYKAFITNYPESKFIKTARDSIKAIKHIEAFRLAMKVMNETGWTSFKEQFPDSRLKVKADYYIDSLWQDSVFTACLQIEDFEAYLTKYPKGVFVGQATKLIDSLKHSKN